MYSKKGDRYEVHLYNVGPNGEQQDEDTETSKEFLCAKFSPLLPSLLVLGNEFGAVKLVDVNTTRKEDDVSQVFKASDYGVVDVDWMITLVGQCVFMAATGSGNILQYYIDPKTKEAGKIWTCRDDSPVTCIATYPPQPGLMIVGLEDGKICIWNECKEIVMPCLIQKRPHPSVVKQKFSEQDNAITCLFLKSGKVLLSASRGNDFIQMWDPSKLDAPLKSFHAKAVVTSITMHRNNICRAVSDLFYASCMDNHIYGYNLESKFKCSEPLYSFVGHQVNSLYVKISVSRCGNYLASGSSDGYVYLWSTNLALANMKGKEAEDELPQVLPLAKLDGHLGEEVTAVDWSFDKDKIMLVSVGDDHSYRLWHVKPRDYTEEPDKAEGIEGKLEIVDTSFDKRLSQYRKLSEPVKVTECESDKEVLDLLNKLKYPKPKVQDIMDDDSFDGFGDDDDGWMEFYDSDDDDDNDMSDDDDDDDNDMSDDDDDSDDDSDDDDDDDFGVAYLDDDSDDDAVNPCHTQ